MDVSRRHILAGLGIASLGGCLERFTSNSGIQLGSLRVANTADKPHTVDLVLERDGSRVYNELVEVDPDNHVWIDPTWSSEPAEYDLYYTVSGSDEVSIAELTDAPDDIDGECVVADLWTVMSPSGPDVLLKDIGRYEEATCNF
ncbi:hypothetical protein JMJ58_19105 [Haloterrigena salifodinae]|uniref:Uncharacterized protein n=1 Tax=Haloterrigena salifodinae TaxID=2675099 RepID=A0A8T8E0F5_9EURY|nr:hypothetical protein [Haloterrigena salifodinae]QRV14993.1 hypothetical protein JMJ58_19105 [Haloterrigena salifodinae]